MNRVITFISLFATVVFLTLTFILGFLIHYIEDRENPLFWFMVTIFIGSFLSLLICLGNINSTVKLSKQKLLKKETDDINFTTCPDYWTKRLLKSNGKTVTMCYNQFTDNNGNIVLIDGKITSNVDGYSFINSNFKSNLDDYRAKAIYSNIETFTSTNMYGEYTDSLDPNYQSNLHTHFISIVADSNNSNIDGNSNVPSHAHVYYDQGRRSHSHSPSWNITTSVENTFTNVEGMSNFDHWISPVKSLDIPGGNEYAIQINLNKLNEANNSCELAKMFNWGETSKCFRS